VLKIQWFVWINVPVFGDLRQSYLDYHLIVVEDGCADRDPEVHKLLMEKVFPRQATVVSSAEMVAALAA
jgi:isochorismate hydrolase